MLWVQSKIRPTQFGDNKCRPGGRIQRGLGLSAFRKMLEAKWLKGVPVVKPVKR